MLLTLALCLIQGEQFACNPSLLPHTSKPWGKNLSPHSSTKYIYTSMCNPEILCQTQFWGIYTSGFIMLLSLEMANDLIWDYLNFFIHEKFFRWFYISSETDFFLLPSLSVSIHIACTYVCVYIYVYIVRYVFLNLHVIYFL